VEEMTGMRRGRPLTRVLAMLLLATASCGTLTVEEEKQLGQQAQREVRERFQLFRDRVVVNYVRQMGKRLIAGGGPSPFEFRFYVVEDESINAFAVPGGAIYVNTGLILEAHDSSELASVLAHEAGHVTARHVAQLYRRQRNTGVGANLLSLAIAILSGNPYIANAGQLATGAAATAYTSTFTREAEREADSLAVETMINAGYDPKGMVAILQTLKQQGGGGGPVWDLLNSHPGTDERIASVTADIDSRSLPGNLERDDGGKLEIIQERIRLLMGTDEMDEDL
jgi:predicted Zn-dependent protease